ncbi:MULTISPECIES: hypothetical protein [Psychroflexus]|uniref:Uncharacterized protein n=2 Tax=Psychroflexus TaxID=83612 RepID=A0A917E8T3_9FLAO|nr:MULTISPECIES: hypothetical protein [Psychroflexus]GGE14577.1 hypothetical protein GCM10010831_14920 [Psychroflexus salis]GGE44624.1 hypothetical protein GCM10010832_25730 [Psychroflexus planctonicus]
MKKLVLTLVLGVFAFGSSGFVTNDNDPITVIKDCNELQHVIFAFYYNNGWGSDYAWDRSIRSYERCEARKLLGN